MSNSITFQPCEFNDVRTGRVCKGCRLYDEYGKDYVNLWEDIPDDDMEVIARCIDNFVGIYYHLPSIGDLSFWFFRIAQVIDQIALILGDDEGGFSIL